MANLKLIACLLLPLSAGCANNSDSSAGTAGSRSVAAAGPINDDEFRRKVNQVQPGTPKAAVLRELGKPDERHPGVAGTPRVGPQPPETVYAGSRYEEWIYRRGGTNFHIFIAGSQTDPGRWEVVSVAAAPGGAVEH